MVLRLFKAAWFISLFIGLVVLLYIYASLPEKVVVQEDSAKLVSLSRDVLFYLALFGMAIVNVLVFAVSRLYKSKQRFRSWFYGLVVTLNIFFVVALNLINLFNSGERFDYNSIAFIVYGSVILMIVWSLIWPFYYLYEKIYSK